MQLGGKIFLHFMAAWLLMPVALLVAQGSGLAQAPGFVMTIVLITSVGPLQIYVNEIYAPLMACYRGRVGTMRLVQVGAGVVFLGVWACWRMALTPVDMALVALTLLAFIGCSFETAWRTLALQASSVIGGRESFVIGAIPPLIFLLLVLVFQRWPAHDMMMYALILLPTLMQYVYTRYRWPDAAPVAVSTTPAVTARSDGIFLMVALVLTFVAQQWKISLADLAVGYAALLVYLISPLCSLWLIVAKSRYVAQAVDPSRYHPVRNFWVAPAAVLLTLLIPPASWWLALLMALLSQALTFRFITNTRQHLTMAQPGLLATRQGGAAV